MTNTTLLGDGEVAWLSAGDGEAPVALLLHGFPDTPHCFEPLMPALADAGWHAVAPWLPGYAPSAVPSSGDYRVPAVAATMTELCDSISPVGPIAVVGHDWGAGIAYEMCAALQDRVTRAVAMSVPHPSALAAALAVDYVQQKRSWYVFLFQIPGLAEMAVGANGLAFVDHLVADWSPGWDVPESYHRHVADAIGAPANLGAALGYYRAMFGAMRGEARRQPSAAGGPVTSPVLYLHGSDDGCVGVEHAALDKAPIFTGDYAAEIVEGCGHFLLQEKPAEVAARIVDWLGPPPATSDG